LVIDLFGLLGMAGVAIGPVDGHIIDRLIPWYASLVDVMILVLFQSVQLEAGGIHIAAVIVSTFGLDVFRQMLQGSLTTAIFGYGFHHLSQFTLRSYFPPRISTSARVRVNAVPILCERKKCFCTNPGSNNYFCRFSSGRSSGHQWALTYSLNSVGVPGRRCLWAFTPGEYSFH